MVLRDSRRLGRVRLEPAIERLGPDAAEISRADFRARVGRGRTAVKSRIMDQAVLAGVGNLLADEALWKAAIDPRHPAAELAEAELDRLRNAIRAANRSAIAKGGVHTGAVIPARRRDGVCPRCGTPMARGTVGGRTTYWCPAEQR
jgi:formamidopyrimidine-DNA glycosylase